MTPPHGYLNTISKRFAPDNRSCSVVLGVLGIGKVENDGRMRSSTTTVAGEDALEIDRPVETETSVGKDVNPVALVVSRGVDN